MRLVTILACTMILIDRMVEMVILEVDLDVAKISISWAMVKTPKVGLLAVWIILEAIMQILEILGVLIVSNILPIINDNEVEYLIISFLFFSTSEWSM